MVTTISEDLVQPLTTDASNKDVYNRRRHGTWFYISFHTATVMIGAGVLALPWAFSYLGVIGGLSVLYLGFFVSLISADALLTLHEQEGKRFDTYYKIGLNVFGHKFKWVVPLFQMWACVGALIGYPIVGGESMQKIYEMLFPEHANTDVVWWILIFGLIQIILSQLPDIHSLRFVSLMGVIMSIGYSSCVIVSSTIHAVQSEEPIDYRQRQSSNLVQILLIGNAIGTVIYAYTGLSALPEIQSTLPSPSYKAMRNGTIVSYLLAIVLYTTVALTGYWAFGNKVQGNIMVSLVKPAWLVIIANGMVMLHVVAANQVFARIIFIQIEEMVFQRYDLKLIVFSILRSVVRVLLVAVSTAISAYLPFFTAIAGFSVSGGMCTFILPSLLALVYLRKQVIIWQSLSYIVVIIVFSIVVIYASVGSVYNIVLQKAS